MRSGVTAVALAWSFTMFTRLRVPVSAELLFTTMADPVLRVFNPLMSRIVPVVTEPPTRSRTTPAARAAEAVTLKITVSSFPAEAISATMPELVVAPV